MHEKIIGRGRVCLSQGDITESSTEAIVNAANNHLWMGAGVAGAIKSKGGPIIEEEALAMGPIEVGDAVATGAGALRARYVIHAAGMGQDLRTSGKIVASCTLASLRLAERLGVASVAFPARGTGVGGLAVEEAAGEMLRAVSGFMESEADNVEKVEFVLFGERDFQVFVAELENAGA